jgi:hypothetical protein
MRAQTNEQHDAEHHRQMMEQGARAMGFSQTSTTHHFRLTKSGGAIEVEANDRSDLATREQIRRHLQAISRDFAQGDFSSPMVTHGKTPPGVPELQRGKRNLSYEYVDTKGGGKVVISAGSMETLQAVHEFLRYQIHEHQTGDSEKVGK